MVQRACRIKHDASDLMKIRPATDACQFGQRLFAADTVFVLQEFCGLATPEIFVRLHVDHSKLHPVGHGMVENTTHVFRKGNKLPAISFGEWRVAKILFCFECQLRWFSSRRR